MRPGLNESLTTSSKRSAIHLTNPQESSSSVGGRGEGEGEGEGGGERGGGGGEREGVRERGVHNRYPKYLRYLAITGQKWTLGVGNWFP